MRVIATTVMSAIVLLALASSAQAQVSPRGGKTGTTSTRPVRTAPLPAEIMGSKLYTYSRWMKFCGRDRNSPTNICLIALEVKRHAGPFAAGAALIEGAGDKRVFRITLPADVRREAGAQVAVDRDKSRSAEFIGCTDRGCVADFDANAEFIARLRDGETLHLRGTDPKGRTVSFRLPLTTFAAAADGPPSAPPR